MIKMVFSAIYLILTFVFYSCFGWVWDLEGWKNLWSKDGS